MTTRPDPAKYSELLNDVTAQGFVTSFSLDLDTPYGGASAIATKEGEPPIKVVASAFFPNTPQEQQEELAVRGLVRLLEKHILPEEREMTEALREQLAQLYPNNPSQWIATLGQMPPGWLVS